MRSFLRQNPFKPVRVPMNRRRRYILILALAAAAFLSAAVAQMGGETVTEIRIEGNEQLSRGAVLSYVQTRVGQSFDERRAREDEQRLMRTRRFRRADVSWARTDDGVVVTIAVEERPLIKEVVFRGNKSIKDADVAKEVAVGVGDPVDRIRIESGRQSIETLYRSKGYYQADVTIDLDALDENRVVYQVVEGPQVRVRKIVFEGRESFSAWRLRRQIGTSRRIWPFVPGYLDTEQVERDVLAIRNFYLGEGFLDVEVGRRYEFSADGEDATVYFLIREGPRYRVNRFVFRGNKVFADDELVGRIETGGGLERREFFSMLEMQRTVEAVENAYGEIGFINADVEARKQYLDPEDPLPDWARGMDDEPVAVLNIVVDVIEEDQYRVGKVVIRGNDVTQDRVVRRELRFYPEQLFNTVAVADSRRRLMETRLFDEVTITPTGDEEGSRDALVSLTEARTAEFLVGVGVSSNSGLLGNISFTQRNFDLFGWPNADRPLGGGRAWKGAGQTFRIVAEPGTELMRFHIDWFEPYLFDQPYSLGTKAFVFTRVRESYDEMRYGGVVSVGHRFRNRWYGEVATRLEGVEIDELDSDAPRDVRDDEGTHALLGVKGSLIRDRTDSRWLPSTGDRFELSYEQVMGTDSFGVGQADYHIYRTLYVDALDRKHIIAGRAMAGHIFGGAPVFERFYAGGIGSIRGFEYRGVSPRGIRPSGSVGDDPVGGEFIALLGTEYTFPLVGEQLRGVVFLDTGTVEEQFEVTTWRAAAGAGIRWIVPLFGPVPMSLDFAVPINADDEDDEQIVSFTFGWTF